MLTWSDLNVIQPVHFVLFSKYFHEMLTLATKKKKRRNNPTKKLTITSSCISFYSEKKIQKPIFVNVELNFEFLRNFVYPFFSSYFEANHKTQKREFRDKGHSLEITFLDFRIR